MTVCIATLCDNGTSIVLVADKMMGVGGFAQADLNIHKIDPIHRDWRLLIAGNGIEPVFEMIDYAREKLNGDRSLPVTEVMDIVARAYRKERWKRIAANILAPLGMTAKVFFSDEGRRRLGPTLHAEITTEIREYNLGISLIAAGFDNRSRGQIISIGNPGVASRHDKPGFSTIGGGCVAAYYMLLYREMTARMPLESALYYAFEAKVFAEQAPGVGYRTDIYLMRAGKRPQQWSIKGSKKLDNMWARLKPREVTAEQREAIRRLPEVRKLRKTT